MDEAAKRRLAGAAVLVALAVIFVPMLVEDKQSDGVGEPIVIPEPPDFDARYDESATPSEQTLEGAPPAAASGPGPLPAPPPPDDEPATVSAPQRPASRPAPRPTTAAAPRPAETPAPAVVGPKPVPPGARSWVVQVASVGNAEAARGLQDKLRAKGYPAFVEQARVNGKLYYRVRVGPEIDRGRADSVARKLAGETGSTPYVQRYP